MRKILFKSITMITSVAITMCSLFALDFTNVAYATEEQEVQTTVWEGDLQYVIEEVNGHAIATVVAYNPSNENQKSIAIPYRVKGAVVSAIGESVFKESKIESVLLSNGIKRIGDYAFYDSALKIINVGENVEIGKQAFGLCVGMADEQGFVIMNRTLYDGYNAIPDENGVITIPDGVRTIAGYAFTGDGQGEIIEELALSESVRTIESYAFADRQIDKITLCEEMRVIEANGFGGIKGLERVWVPGRLEEIGKDAFVGSDGKVIEIHGYEASLAEVYARENEVPFVAVGRAISTESYNKYQYCAGNVSWDSAGLTAMDALTILKYVVHIEEEIDERLADADGNGSIDAEDALLVLKCVVNLEKPRFLSPADYDIYSQVFGPLSYDDDYVVDNSFSWKVIESKEELNQFIEQNMPPYLNIEKPLGVTSDEKIKEHWETLDDAYFEKYVYVVTLNGYFGYGSSLQGDCIEYLGEDQGLHLKLAYGSFEDGVVYPCIVVQNLYAGITIPRSDLNGQEITNVTLTAKTNVSIISL